MPSSAALSMTQKEENAWRNFNPGDWCTSIAVRDFIVRNATPYSGDEKFLAASSARTKAVWAKLQPYFQEERKKGVLAQWWSESVGIYVIKHIGITVLIGQTEYTEEQWAKITEGFRKAAVA